MDANAIRLGANNYGADKLELFLKVFGGEVLTAFEGTNVTLDKQLVRSIDHGKSATFPATWKVNSRLHTPGAEITGQQSPSSERVISIDGLLIADVFIPNIDEAMNHYDVRSIYSTECGRALAKSWDENSFRMMLLASRASATVDGGNGGSLVKDTNAESSTLATKADAIAGLIYDSAQALDEKDIPEFDRYAFMKPEEYYALVNSTKAINRDYRGEGSYARGKVNAIADVTIVKSNNVVRDTNVTSTVPDGKYDVDGTDAFGVVVTPAAIGTVKLMDLALETEYQINRQGWLIVAKYAIGTGILRPECSVELSWAA